MKKTTIAIATISLLLTLVATASGQARRRAPQQVGNPFGLGGTVTSGVKNRQPATFRKRIDKASPVTNLGDTGTHEVGHKSKRRNAQFRPSPTGDGTTQHFRKTNTNGQNNRSRNPQATNPLHLKIEGVDGESIRKQQPNAAKYDGIDGESNDARTKQPNGRRKTQNLLPYMEQSNLKARTRSKQLGAGNQVEAKTKAKGN